MHSVSSSDPAKDSGLQRAQGVAYDDALPAQVDQGKVIRLGQVAPLLVRGQEVVGTNTRVEEGFVSVAAGSGGAFVNEVGDQPLRAPGEIAGLVLPAIVRLPGAGRTLKGARAGGDEFGGDGSGQPLEVEPPLGAVIVVGAPTGVADDAGLVVERARGFVEPHAAGGQQHGGGAQPVVAGFVLLRLQVDYELAAIARLARAI